MSEGGIVETYTGQPVRGVSFWGNPAAIFILFRWGTTTRSVCRAVTRGLGEVMFRKIRGAVVLRKKRVSRKPTPGAAGISGDR
jgi:hypothetical protein